MHWRNWWVYLYFIHELFRSVFLAHKQRRHCSEWCNRYATGKAFDIRPRKADLGWALDVHAGGKKNKRLYKRDPISLVVGGWWNFRHGFWAVGSNVYVFISRGSKCNLILLKVLILNKYSAESGCTALHSPVRFTWERINTYSYIIY